MTKTVPDPGLEPTFSSGTAASAYHLSESLNWSRSHRSRGCGFTSAHGDNGGYRVGDGQVESAVAAAGPLIS